MSKNSWGHNDDHNNILIDYINKKELIKLLLMS